MHHLYLLGITTFCVIVVYLTTVAYLFYLVKKRYPDFWNKLYPYGLMMNKVSQKPSLFSANYFKIGLTTFSGHAHMATILLTSKLSEDVKIKRVKNIARLLLVCALVSVLYLVFTIVTTTRI